MNSICSRTLKISTLALSVLLASCGEDSSQTLNKQEADEKPSGQVVAVVNDEEITIHELNSELSRVKLTESNREKMTQTMLKSLVTRTVFKQNARKMQMDRFPNIMMEIERSKATILAKAYLQSQMINKPDVPRSEVEAYIFDNPHKFSNRAYYTFDSLIVPNTYLTKERREAWETVTDLNEIESVLLSEGLDYKRVPFTSYSENLPAGVVKDMPKLKLNGDVFFILMKGQSYLNIYKDSHPAVLTGEEAFKVAKKYLTTQKTKEFLVKLEADVLANASIEYLGDFKYLSEKENTAEDAAANDEDSKPAVTPTVEDDK